MRRVFADSGYWVALLNPQDALHHQAVAAARDYSEDQVFTSEMVLVEFLNGFSNRGPRLRGAAARAVRALRSSPGWPALAKRMNLPPEAI